MKTTIPLVDIEEQLILQLSSLFKFSEEEKQLINIKIKEVFSRREYCFSCTNEKYYLDDGDCLFNPYHSDQYAIFLYYFSNTIFRLGGAHLLADKLYFFE